MKKWTIRDIQWLKYFRGRWQIQCSASYLKSWGEFTHTDINSHGWSWQWIFFAELVSSDHFLNFKRVYIILGLLFGYDSGRSARWWRPSSCNFLSQESRANQLLRPHAVSKLPFLKLLPGSRVVLSRRQSRRTQEVHGTESMNEKCGTPTESKYCSSHSDEAETEGWGLRFQDKRPITIHSFFIWTGSLYDATSDRHERSCRNCNRSRHWWIDS